MIFFRILRNDSIQNNKVIKKQKERSKNCRYNNGFFKMFARLGGKSFSKVKITNILKKDTDISHYVVIKFQNTSRVQYFAN